MKRDNKSNLERLVTGCIAMLFTVQQCTSEAVSEAAMEHALDSALRHLMPGGANEEGANNEGYAAVAENIKTLKSRLGSNRG